MTGEPKVTDPLLDIIIFLYIYKGFMRRKKKSYVKKTEEQTREWFPLFIVQPGKFAPRLYDVVLKREPAKGGSYRTVDYSKMRMELLKGGKHLSTLLERKRGRKNVYRNRYRIIDGLADFLIENIKLGVIHGEIEMRHIFLKGKRKKLDVKKIYDFDWGGIADTKHTITKTGHKNPKGHAKDYYGAAYVVERIAESSNKKGPKLKKEKKELLNYLKKRFEKRIEEVM